jgi:flavodoxin
MEEKFKIFKGAIGFEHNDNVAYVAVPLPRVVEKRGKWQVQNEVYLVTGDFQFWPLTQEEQKRRKSFYQSLPQFPVGKEYWRKEDIEEFVKSRGKPHVDPYMEVFEPIRDVLEENIDFHHPLDSTLIAIWIMGTYLLPIFTSYPYILLTGTRGSGKTKVLEVVSRLAFNAQLTSNATPSAIFRIIEANQATILIDEGEMLSSREDSQELRLILNAGYRRNNPVSRTNKETHEIQWFDTFSPKMIAAINPLDSTLRSRCLQVTMVRTANKEKGNKQITDNTTCWVALRDGLYRYALQCMPEVKEILEYDEDVNILECRQNELWKPLLAIAKHLNLYVTSTVFEELKERALEENVEEDTLDDWHKAVLLALNEIVASTRPYTIKEIREEMTNFIEDVKEMENITNRWIGNALARFGLKKGKRKEEGNTYIVNRGEVEDLLERYQLKETEPPELTEHTEGGRRESETEIDLEEVSKIFNKDLTEKEEI